MNESDPQIPSQEVTRERLVALLKEKGLEDPESIAAYAKWCEQRELQVNGYSEQQMFEFEKARLFIETGDQGCIDYAYNEILGPMVQNGKVLFEEKPELKVLLDEFYK
jgi:hypothetical protein